MIQYCRLPSIIAVFLSLTALDSMAQVRALEQRSNSALVYHGKLVRPNGEVVDGTLNVSLKILSPEPTQCVLWKESQTITVVKGSFSMELGYNSNRAATGAGSSSSGAATFRDVFLNHPGLTINSSECESGSTYSPSESDDRLMAVTFTDGSNVVSVEKIPIKAVPFAQQALEVGGYGSSNLLRISGAGYSQEFSPTEMQTLKDLLGGNIDWNLGGQQITNVADPVAATDAANKQWVENYVAANSAGTLDSSAIVSALGYTPVSASSPAEVQTALGYTPVNRAGDTMTGSLEVNGSGQFSGSLTTLSGVMGGSLASSELLLSSTSHATKGKIRFGASYYDESTNRLLLGLSTASPRQVGDRTSRFQMEGGPNNNGGLSLVTNNSSVSNYPALVLGHSNGSTAGDVTAVAINNALGGILFAGADGSTLNSVAARIKSDVDGTVATGIVPGRITLSTASSSGSLTERMRIDSAGQIGMGTTSPGYRLDVVGDVNVSGNFKINGVNIFGTSTAFSGDVSGNYNSISVDRVKGTSISSTSPSSAGQVLRYNGSTQYEPAFLSLSDIRSTVTPGNSMFPAGSCNAGQTLTWVSLTDTMTCTSIAIGDSAITYASKAQNSVFAGPATGGSGSPTFRTLAESDIPSLNASKIGAGTLSVANGGTGLSSLTTNQILYATGSTSLGQITTSNNSLLVTNGSGVPSFTALSGDTFSQYALLAGRSGGQILRGGIGATEDLTIDSTSHGTKGDIILNGTGGNVGIGTTSPVSKLQIESSSSATTYGSSSIADQGLTLINSLGVGSRPYGIQFGHNLGQTFGGLYGVGGSLSSNTSGDIAIALRAAHADTNFTEMFRVRGTSGRMTFNTPTTTTSDGVETQFHFLNKWTSALEAPSATMTIARTGTNTTGTLLDLNVERTANSAFNLISAKTGYGGTPVTHFLVRGDGNVGVGTTSPAAKLEVAGDLKIGNSSATCNSATEGSQRYNSTSKNMEFCNGTAWTAYGASGGGSGSIAGTAYAETGTTITCSAMPATTVAPTTSNGSEIVTLAYSAKSSTNKLRFTVSVPVSQSTAGSLQLHMGAIFNGSTLIGASVGNSATYFRGIFFYQFEITAGTTSSQTFALRFGQVSGHNQAYVNPDGPTIPSKASMSILEYAP